MFDKHLGGLFSAGSDGRSIEVMFFMPQLGGGGAEMNAVRLAEGLRAHGVEPVYVVARGPGSYAEYLPDDVPVHVLATGCINRSNVRLARAVGPLARLIDSRKPDIVCPVMPYPAFAALAAVRLARHRPNVVLSVQNVIGSARVTRQGVMGWLERALLARMFPSADAAVALSNGVARDLSYWVPALAGRVSVVFNVGVPLTNQLRDPPAHAQLALGPPRRFRFLACGRLVEQKGYPWLLYAFADVVREHDAQLDILGDGPLRSKLEALVDHLGLPGRVNFLGFQNNPYEHMRAADVFVLSSLWEGFGNVIVEAMSMGAPVISTACPYGPAEIITHERDGLLVPIANCAALTQAMLRLARDPDLRARLTQGAAIRAEDFTAGRIAEQYADVFYRVVNTRECQQ